MAELTAGGPIRVVLVDDHPIWRDGLRADLADGFEVVGEAASAAEAVAVIGASQPDLVVCDLHMPGGGITVARACGDTARVVMLTVSEAERDLLDAVAAGAIGYLVKSTPGPELRAALLRAAAGEPVFSPALAALVLGEFRRIAKASSAQPLSERGTRGPAAGGPGPHLPPDRGRAVHRGKDRREPRPQHPGQAPSLQEERVDALRHRTRHRIAVGRHAVAPTADPDDDERGSPELNLDGLGETFARAQGVRGGPNRFS